MIRNRHGHPSLAVLVQAPERLIKVYFTVGFRAIPLAEFGLVEPQKKKLQEPDQQGQRTVVLVMSGIEFG
jgi:hypothetical protein